MTKAYLEPPLPIYNGPYQPGITDPSWPAQPPVNVGNDQEYFGLYAGQIDRQRHLHIITANVTVETPRALGDLLSRLTDFARHQMRKPPVRDSLRPLDPPVKSNRLTIGIGFGFTLFTTIQGDDRFGLSAKRPISLKVMPQIDGDENFKPGRYATDLIFLVASDNFYVNEYVFGKLYYATDFPGLSVKNVEKGYARPDGREPSGFEDGITNPKLGGRDSLESYVYVGSNDNEPEWCVNGTYLAYRKVVRRLRQFFHFKKSDQEKIFGVDKHSGIRKPDPKPNSHGSKMNPRRGDHLDLFDCQDEERRFLRRPYFFNDGIDSTGEEIRGVHHLSFSRNLIKQYEWPVQMWQTNPNFPTPGSGNDALYGPGGAANIAGGYYFFPPSPNESRHLGSDLLEGG